MHLMKRLAENGEETDGSRLLRTLLHILHGGPGAHQQAVPGRRECRVVGIVVEVLVVIRYVAQFLRAVDGIPRFVEGGGPVVPQDLLRRLEHVVVAVGDLDHLDGGGVEALPCERVFGQVVVVADVEGGGAARQGRACPAERAGHKQEEDRPAEGVAPEGPCESGPETSSTRSQVHDPPKHL